MNYQNFGFNKTVYSSPSFQSNTDFKFNPSFYPYTPPPIIEKEDFSSFSQKKIEDFLKDNLSNIEEVNNHSFNSGEYQEILQKNPVKSHFLDDYELRKQNSNSKNWSNYRNDGKNSNENEQNEIKSDINFNVNKKTDDLVQMLDTNDLSCTDVKRKANLNEFTIQPDLETRSVYYANENRPMKHGPYSMDMSKNQILDSDLQQKDYFYQNQEPFYQNKEPFYQNKESSSQNNMLNCGKKDLNYENNSKNTMNNMTEFNNYNAIYEKKIERKPSHHQKGYSGDMNITNFLNNDKKDEKKHPDYLNLFSNIDYAKKEQKFEYQPVIKERTNFIDIYKGNQIEQSSVKLTSDNKRKEEGQFRKPLPPLFNPTKKNSESERTSPEREYKKNAPPNLQTPVNSAIKTEMVAFTPKIMINGSKFSANQKNIFDMDLDVRKSITITEETKFQNQNIQNISYNFPQNKNLMSYNDPKSMFSGPTIDQPLFEAAWKVDYFEMGSCLGRGKFSTVYIARDKRTKYIVALKIIQKQILKETGAEHALAQEIKIQSFCDHPNILKLYGYINEDERIILILEFAAHGQLFDELKQQPMKRFDEAKASLYVRQILQAIQYLHVNEIMHRDIKPENIMISHGVLKLSDFGWAAFSPCDKRRETFCGTLDYVSPEVVEGHPYDYSVDIWSLGVLCYELCEGKAPFLHESTAETYLKILNCLMEIPEHFSNDLKDLIKKVFRKNPEERPKINELIHHSWFEISSVSSFIDLRENSIFSKLMTI